MENNTSGFLPMDYRVPVTNNYMKLTEGEHTFRVMSSAIVGYVYFTNENKPVRSREAFEDTPTDLKKDGRVNPFWAFVVYNYEAKRFQILEITQKSLMLPIKSLTQKWGHPNGYDITITRTGTTKNDTEYAVMPNPPSPISQEIQQAYEAKKINLDALYLGDDPFKTE